VETPMLTRSLAAMLLFASVACVAAQPFEDRALDAVTSPELRRFSSETAFRDYVAKLQSIVRKRRHLWSGAPASRRGLILAANAPEPTDPPCDPALGPCPVGQVLSESVIVTGARATSPSITNNQTAGVDEGDIVKQIGHYLITLQDGRLFVADIEAMTVTDRFDVYRRDEDGDPIGADWYDEMLVQDNHIIVTAYSYDDRATELSIFALDQNDGRITRRGVFLISSDDYYSSDNYATRIIGDRLILYTPYEAEQLLDPQGHPVVRKWQAAQQRRESQQTGKPLFGARDIYRPVMRLGEPTIHTISICPLRQIGQPDAMLDCQTTGFVGPEAAERFVSTDNVYLWLSNTWEVSWWRREECSAQSPNQPATRRDVVPAAVYRIPVRGGQPAVAATAGHVFDQFSMDEGNRRFRALVRWENFRCQPPDDAPTQVALFDMPLGDFSEFYDERAPQLARHLPPVEGGIVENRFAGPWLIYGGRSRWPGYPPETDAPPQRTSAIAVPLQRMAKTRTVPMNHDIQRLERVGEEQMMISGYGDDSGLAITLLSLKGRDVRIVGNTTLTDRFESESRSHAFNSTVFADGSALLGIPTVMDTARSGRWWWNSQSSDLSFIAVDADGHLSDAGFLKAVPADSVEVAAGYQCEVSCIDWYGNSRPIFTADRIFGLLGTELVEARYENRTIVELQRLDLTAPPAR
jgi:hypothetical protein